MLTFEQIKDLVELVAKHRLGNVEVERSGFRLKISSALAPASPPAPAPSVSAQSSEPSSSSRDVAAVSHLAPSVSVGGDAPVDGGAATGAHILTAPIVGTFYAAASPDTAPYVRVGDRVRKGQVVCIVEAMKLMNEIESDADGVVVEVYPRNAQPVEFGEPLFAIRTD